jgi:hypothetical protein
MSKSSWIGALFVVLITGYNDSSCVKSSIAANDIAILRKPNLKDKEQEQEQEQDLKNYE